MEAVMFEHAVYDSEHNKWYKQGDTPWTVRMIPKGEIFKPIFYVNANTSMEAFELLFGHPQHA